MLRRRQSRPVERRRCRLRLLHQRRGMQKAMAETGSQGEWVLRRARAVVVWTVRTLVGESLPGVMVAGRKVAVAPVGTPVAERVMALLKVPLREPAVMV